MRAVIVFAALVAAAAATALSTVSHATSNLDIGTNTFIIVSKGPNSNCPQNVTHGAVDVPALTENFRGYGIEGSLNYSNININGEQCTGGQNDTGIMAILSLDELGRFRSSDVLELNKTADIKVFVAGFDTQPRVCGDYRSGDFTYYMYTKEIGAYEEVFTRFNMEVPDVNVQSGEKWMLSYEPASQAVCVFIDITSQSLKAAGNITGTPTVSPSPSPPIAALPLPLDPEAGPEVSAEATVPPTSGERVCFPSVATVELADGSFKTMDKVQLGDRVKVADGIFSDVFMFTHKLADVNHEFVTLKTESAELALTSGHMLYVNRHLVPASSVKAGDMIESDAGAMLRVVSVHMKTMTGLYNPQTTHGDIIVNGIRASTFTTAVAPKAAHALLAPLRALYARLGFVSVALDKGSEFVPTGATALLA